MIAHGRADDDGRMRCPYCWREVDVSRSPRRFEEHVERECAALGSDPRGHTPENRRTL